MPCDPYKSRRCADDLGTVCAGGRRSLLRFVLGTLALLTSADGAVAQWWFAPVECCPPPCCGPVCSGPPQSVVVQRPIVQLDSPPTGPVWPSLAIPGPQPAVTGFPPAEGVSSPPVATRLDDISGELRVVLTENLLNRLLTRNDTNAGPIHDFILGADVTGEQTTESRVTVKVQPSAQTARLFVELTGTTFNQTVGVTPRAAVRSRGTHEFRLTKQIDFDGVKFTTRSPAAWVTPRLTNEGAVTPMSGVPLIGPLATQIALTEAERRRPITEQVVSQRVTGEVAPRFNTEVDQLLGTANARLRTVVPRLLTASGFTRSQQHLSSSEDRIQFGLSLSGIGHSLSRYHPNRSALPTSPDGNDGWVTVRQVGHHVSMKSRPLLPPPQVTGGTAATIAIHESLVNHLLGRATLEGRQVPDRTIDRVLSLLKDALSGRSIQDALSDQFGADEPEFATILLANEQPLSVLFEEGQVIIVARAGFLPTLTPEVPTQRVEIPFTLQTGGGEYSLVPGAINIQSLPGQPAGPMEEIARPVIRQQVESRLYAVPLPASIPVRLPGLAETSLSLRDVTLSDGWLIIAVD